MATRVITDNGLTLWKVSYEGILGANFMVDENKLFNLYNY